MAYSYIVWAHKNLLFYYPCSITKSCAWGSVIKFTVLLLQRKKTRSRVSAIDETLNMVPPFQQHHNYVNPSKYHLTLVHPNRNVVVMWGVCF